MWYLQSLYKNFRGVETALKNILLQFDTLAILEHKRGVLLGLLDLAEAFDTDDHGTLLRRLEEPAGVTCSALAWAGAFWQYLLLGFYASQFISQS